MNATSWICKGAIGLLVGLASNTMAIAQTPVPEKAAQTHQANEIQAEKEKKNLSSMTEEMEEMRQLIEQMRQRIEQQDARIRQLELERTSPISPAEDASVQPDRSPENLPVPDLADNTTPLQTTPPPPAQLPATAQIQTIPLSADDRDTLDFWRDTTLNVVIDGYYSYNFNRPLGGINLLRVNEVLSNSLTLQQAGLVLERPPKIDENRRFGARLDLMFGEATESFQGSALNELRPQAYRHIWQGYGTYVAPLGKKGLTLDFGKFASPLGIETNYSKDDFNYSRSYWFNILPFYHLGFRAAYPLTDKFTATYWLVNGIQQSEDFNSWKSQAALLTYKSGNRFMGQLNYYIGREGRVRTSILNPTFPILPTQPGLTPVEVQPAPNGYLHIFDAYATYKATQKLTFAIEGDNLVNRGFSSSPPSRISGGAAYARYQFTHGFAVAGRFEYAGDNLSDFGESIFSGLDQDLKEGTFTAEYKFGEGFLLRGEMRRDWSNEPFFLTSTPGVLKKFQTTATFAVVWWFGRKKDMW